MNNYYYATFNGSSSICNSYDNIRITYTCTTYITAGNLKYYLFFVSEAEKRIENYTCEHITKESLITYGKEHAYDKIENIMQEIIAKTIQAQCKKGFEVTFDDYLPVIQEIRDSISYESIYDLIDAIFDGKELL